VEAQFLLLQHLLKARLDEGEASRLLAESRLDFNVACWITWINHGSVLHRVAVQVIQSMQLIRLRRSS
jgi:hypothetical protein